MKKIITTFSIIASVIGCQQIEPIIMEDILDDETFAAATEGFGTETKTSLDQSNTVVWSSDDQIAIFMGSSNPSRYQVKGAVSGSSNVTFTKVSSPASAGSQIATNVAFYPYSASVSCTKDNNSDAFLISGVTLPSVQTYRKESFAEETFPMAAVTDGKQDRNLKFKNIGGALMLQLKGSAELKTLTLKGNAGEILSGSAEVKVYVGGRTPEITMAKDGSQSLTIDCGNGILLDKSVVTEFIFALPPTEFSKGFTIEVTDTEGGKAVLSTDKANSVGRSAIRKMDAITVKTTPAGEEPEYINLSSNGRANSYIVSKAGSYRIRTVKGHSAEEVENVRSAEVLWESFGTSSAPSKGSLIKNISYSDGYICFTTAASFKEGNAVVAAKDKDGNVVWSWHIWLTDMPKEHSYDGGYILMDRNLGATSAVPGEVQSLGLLYQWGRKDPFLNAGETNSSTQAASTISWPESVISTTSTGSEEYAIAHPTTFIRQHLQAYCWDWLYGTKESGSIDNTRWNSSKGMYDPCPAGWRVPDGGENSPWMESGFAEIKAGKGGLSATLNSEKAWYPATGWKSNKNTTTGKGKLSGAGETGYYWTIEPAEGDSWYHAYYMVIANSGCNPANGYGQRSAGYAVRCQKM
jgi:hypothetical protein